jgi:hypothetical protein
MSANSFVIVLCISAALLAVWIVARWPTAGPKGLSPGLIHVMLAVVVGAVTAPAIRAIAELGVPGAAFVGTFGVALPALTYMFLATMWLMRVMRDYLL